MSLKVTELIPLPFKSHLGRRRGRRERPYSSVWPPATQTVHNEPFSLPNGHGQPWKDGRAHKRMPHHNMSKPDTPNHLAHRSGKNNARLTSVNARAARWGKGQTVGKGDRSGKEKEEDHVRSLVHEQRTAKKGRRRRRGRGARRKENEAPA